MKKNIIRIVSCVIIFTLLFSLSLFCFSEELGKCDCGNTPIIYIRGRSNIYLDKNSPQTDDNYALPYLSEEKKSEIIKLAIPLYPKGFITYNYDELCDKTVEEITDIYSNYVFDGKTCAPYMFNKETGEKITGEPADGVKVRQSGSLWSWKKKKIESKKDLHKKNFDMNNLNEEEISDYIYTYQYYYDFRDNPLKTIDDLRNFVETVKEVTGHDKVSFIARCMGGNILTAYFSKYGNEKDVDKVIIYNPIVNGTTLTNDLFTGNINFDADAINNYVDECLELDIDPSEVDAIKATVKLINSVRGFDWILSFFNKTAEEYYADVIPRVLRASYGSLPGFWSMISSDKYEEARKFVFGGVEEEYSGILAEIDNYHETVGKHIYKIYENLENNGAKVYNIVKYGLPAIPVTANSNCQGDTIVDPTQQSFGCTCSLYGEKLTKAQIAASRDPKYISPDKQIDASTGLFPDTTWYIKNFTHNSYPACVDVLMFKIFREENYDVWADPDYPQYLLYTGNRNHETITPLIEDNTGIEIDSKNIELLISVHDFMRSMVKLIRHMILK